jgi:hypothetical protein
MPKTILIDLRRNTSSGAYQADGQVKKTVELLEHVVRVEDMTLAEDRPSQLASQIPVLPVRSQHVVAVSVLG